jgi:hypothetical protein
MYTNVFLISDGYLSFDVLGFLKEMDLKLSRSVIWNCGSTGALIVFLKCLGFTWDQMTTKLNSLSCLPNIIYGGSLEPGVSKDIKREIVSWMMDIINSKKMFSQDTTMKEVYKLTGIFPNMLTSKGSINPKSHPDVTLLDAVLTSMCNFGVYDTHKIDDEEYTSFIKYNVFPLGVDVKMDGISTETLYIANYSKLTNIEVFSVFDGIENKLSQEYFDRVHKIAEQTEEPNFVLINGVFSKNDLASYDIDNRMDNGKQHARMFNRSESTLSYMDTIISNIKNQS